MLSKQIGIDLGTVQTLIVMPKRGIVINEPTVVARDLNSRRILAVGKEAEAMLGKAPAAVELGRPLTDGVIADFRATEIMLKHYLNRAIGRWRPFKPVVLLSVPGGATSTERKAVIDVAIAAGAKAAYLLEEPVAAALGAGVNIQAPSGNLIIDIGGGTAEVAVISLGGIVARHSVRVGGIKIDRAISDHLRRQHGLAVGGRTAETVKRRIGTAMPERRNSKLEVKGRDVASGLPKTITISANEVIDPIQDILERIVLAVRNVLEKTPPELVSDIIDQGILLTGGTSQLKNLDKLFIKVIGVPVTVADKPTKAVARGLERALETLADYQQSLLTRSK